MTHKLIIVVEIVPYQEESARVKREFVSDLHPISRSRIKILNGPNRFISVGICQSPYISKDIPVEKRFEAVIEAENISYFPESNTTTIVIQDWTSYNLDGKVKVSEIVKDYEKCGWEIL